MIIRSSHTLVTASTAVVINHSLAYLKNSEVFISSSVEYFLDYSERKLICICTCNRYISAVFSAVASDDQATETNKTAVPKEKAQGIANKTPEESPSRKVFGRNQSDVNKQKLAAAKRNAENEITKRKATNGTKPAAPVTKSVKKTKKKTADGTTTTTKIGGGTKKKANQSAAPNSAVVRVEMEMEGVDDSFSSPEKPIKRKKVIKAVTKTTTKTETFQPKTKKLKKETSGMSEYAQIHHKSNFVYISCLFPLNEFAPNFNLYN